jgi:predicted nucleic acid-binding protein
MQPAANAMRPAQRKAVDYMQSSPEGKASALPMPPPAPEARRWRGPLLLDTHVLFDLWVFGDPRVQGLADRLPTLDWVATAAMLDEWQHVLGRGRLRPYLPEASAAGSVPSLPLQPRLLPTAPPAPWRSRDPDDQKFLDLAHALRPACLWSRDRALLAHRKRAAAAGVTIEPPELGLRRLGWA